MAAIVRQLNGQYAGGQVAPRGNPWRSAQILMMKARNRL
jgi:hypothetical protein